MSVTPIRGEDKQPPTLRERIEALWLRMFMDPEKALRYNSEIVATMLRRELDKAA
jgi:hypothetical protein